MKDPAFLFYSKDWLEGTAEMFPEEKGVYIDLLCFQHQRGFLPTDPKRLARLVRMSEGEFNQIWQTLKPKFQPTEKGLVNQKLNQMVDQRKEYKPKKIAAGTLAGLMSKSGLNAEKSKKIKQKFNIEDFIFLDGEVIKDSNKIKGLVRRWFNHMVDHMVNNIANGNANEDANGNENEFNNGDDFKKSIWIIEFEKLWKKYFPKQIIRSEEHGSIKSLFYKFREHVERDKKEQGIPNFNSSQEEILESIEFVIQKLPKWWRQRMNVELLDSKLNTLIQQIYSNESDNPEPNSAIISRETAKQILDELEQEGLR